MLGLDNDEIDTIRGAGDIWDMKHLLNFISVPREDFAHDYQIGDEIAEIEPGSFIYDQTNNVFSIQLSKLRDKNIPSKKRVGEIREDILLQLDQYIGEFVSVIYDETHRCLMIQSNIYGLSIKQIENYLTELRFRHLNYIGMDDESPLLVQLRPIIDHQKLSSALGAEFYRRIRIRASDHMEDALIDDDLISEARRTLMKASGVNIDIQISLGRAERSASLDSEEVRKVLRKFSESTEGNKPNIELTMLEHEDAEIETVNLIEPRMTDRISVEVEPRQSIGHEYLFEKMLEKYIQRLPDIRRLLVR